MAIFYLLLLAVTGCAVRFGAVSFVHNFGNIAGLALLAALFLIGHRLSVRYGL